jgi:hypothetical protein
MRKHWKNEGKRRSARGRHRRSGEDRVTRIDFFLLRKKLLVAGIALNGLGWGVAHPAVLGDLTASNVIFQIPPFSFPPPLASPSFIATIPSSEIACSVFFWFGGSHQTDVPTDLTGTTGHLSGQHELTFGVLS